MLGVDHGLRLQGKEGIQQEEEGRGLVGARPRGPEALEDAPGQDDGHQLQGQGKNVPAQGGESQNRVEQRVDPRGRRASVHRQKIQHPARARRASVVDEMPVVLKKSERRELQAESQNPCGEEGERKMIWDDFFVQAFEHQK